mmetsp:Transcript_4702/g.11256  ORF Transcript_4702/g.11256 Transcript_4702/m.11256 type:complete len:188 (-) Transcript_4702:216-779(-)
MTMSARFLLRRALRPSTTRFAATTNTTTRITAMRFFGAPANQAAPSEVETHRYEKLVEESIKKLVTTTNHAHDEQLKPISNEDLEVRLQYFQKVFEEAELCLSDLRDTLFEADYEQYLEECSCAEGALNNAFTAYIDLLEDMRRSSEEQLLEYSEERNTNACNLKRLRKELDQIIEVANNRDKAKIT